MLKIRLKRVGRKHDPSYRIIVTESQKSGQSNKYIDSVGFYDAKVNRKEVDVEKAKKWIGNGAQVTPTVYNLLVDAGAVEGRKKNVLPKKTAPIKEAPVAEETPAPEPLAPKEEAPAVEEAKAEETPENPTE